MARMQFRPVARKVNLGEYATELADVSIEVWVNIPRALFERMVSVPKDILEEDFLQLLWELWNPGESGAWPLEEIRALKAYCDEYDPMLWHWIVKKTWETVLEYQGMVRKK